MTECVSSNFAVCVISWNNVTCERISKIPAAAAWKQRAVQGLSCFPRIPVSTDLKRRFTERSPDVTRKTRWSVWTFLMLTSSKHLNLWDCDAFRINRMRDIREKRGKYQDKREGGKKKVLVHVRARLFWKARSWEEGEECSCLLTAVSHDKSLKSF